MTLAFPVRTLVAAQWHRGDITWQDIAGKPCFDSHRPLSLFVLEWGGGIKGYRELIQYFENYRFCRRVYGFCHSPKVKEILDIRFAGHYESGFVNEKGFAYSLKMDDVFSVIFPLRFRQIRANLTCRK